ncbi:MAG TPA: hypothetical protein VFV70_15285 [Hyphomonadaceae bacterium]|nr:hypothetical protein [Hyphomonadaceae bacterium]
MRILSAVVFALVAAGSASAQSRHLPAEPTFCKPASNEYDAVTAAPFSHSVVFEDDHVRVLEVIVPPLASEPIHIHALPSVMMGDTGGAAGAKFIYTTYRMEGGKFVEVEKQEITPTPGYRTVWSGPEGPHSITNIGTAPMRLTRIEIKPESCAH